MNPKTQQSVSLLLSNISAAHTEQQLEACEKTVDTFADTYKYHPEIIGQLRSIIATKREMNEQDAKLQNIKVYSTSDWIKKLAEVSREALREKCTLILNCA